MTEQEHHRGFATKLSLFLALCAVALLAVQNQSLNTQVTNLQNQVNLNQEQQEHYNVEPAPTENAFEFHPPPSNVRGRQRNLSGRNAVSKDEPIQESKLKEKLNIIQKDQLARGGRKLSSKKSGSSSGKGGSKSSKRCGSSNTNDSATTTQSGDGNVQTARCEDLRQVVFDLTTEIKSLEGQTLRYNALADELRQTAIVAGGNPKVKRRELQDVQYKGELNDNLRILKRQEDLIRSGNERVTELNVVLRESALNLLGLNSNLSDENLALLRDVTYLTQENFDLLNAQTKLSDQISTLNSTLDTYKNLLDNQGDLNGELNQTTTQLEAEIDRLVASNEEYKRLNRDLNNTIGDLTNSNTELANQNKILEGLNMDLNNTIDRLDGEVGDLASEIDRLETQNGQLATEVGRLENATSDLEQVRKNLEDNVTALVEEVDQFSSKVDELQKYNDDLENIVSFVNETSGFLDESMNSVTEYLSEQIVAYRSVATETLQNTFIQRAALWDCSYRDHFGDEAFSKNDKVPIPDSKFDDVMNYVDDRVLQELCLKLDDFEKFLELEFDDPVFTTNHIVSGIASYTYLAFSHYFPDSDEETGITEADWALAGYNCERLPDNKQFVHIPSA
ncbi:unnamed protein product [Cylindrotheca closterium]|uniref:Uncharacterized protein n=1 Tax=Cylindrotheca closterium TaxID=2856 RepID=A0AAD2FFM5_9STRA|nr:unnamed protein product [Cylindrotheca closterium]